jgi:hypothetical protein
MSLRYGEAELELFLRARDESIVLYVSAPLPAPLHKDQRYSCGCLSCCDLTFASAPAVFDAPAAGCCGICS